MVSLCAGIGNKADVRTDECQQYLIIMSESEEEDEHFSRIAQGEYQLVDPQVISSRTSRPIITLQNVSSSPTHFRPSLTSTPILALQKLPDPETVDLPLSCHPSSSPAKQQPQPQVSVLREWESRPQERQYFAVSNRKQIEDVLYDRIAVSRSDMGFKRETQNVSNREVFWSRFAAEDRKPMNLVQTDRPQMSVMEKQPKPESMGSPISAVVASMPVVRKSLSPNGRHGDSRQERQEKQENKPVREIAKEALKISFNSSGSQPNNQKAQIGQNIYFSVGPHASSDPRRPPEHEHELKQEHRHPKIEGSIAQRLREERRQELFRRKPREQRWQEEQWVTATEPRLKQINQSPAKLNQRYLRSEEKHDFRLNSKTQNNEPDQNYIQEGILKQQFLRQMEQRRTRISQELLKLGAVPTTPQKIGRGSESYQSLRSRKKIFSGNEKPDTESQLKRVQEAFKKPGFLRGSPKDVRPQSTAGRIFRALNERRELSSDIKSHSGHKHIDFDSLKSRLIGDRIKVFKTKEGSPQGRPGTLLSGRKFRMNELSPQTRRWYEQHRREIVYQTEKIGSYELLRRYMSEEEIDSRLQQLLLGRVEPRRWSLTMVDEVYARLKDRYMGVSF